MSFLLSDLWNLSSNPKSVSFFAAFEKDACGIPSLSEIKIIFSSSELCSTMYSSICHSTLLIKIPSPISCFSVLSFTATFENLISSETRALYRPIHVKSKRITSFSSNYNFFFHFREIIYVFLTIFLYLLKCPQSLILSALRAFCFCGKPHISRSIFLYFRYQAWLKSW